MTQKEQIEEGTGFNDRLDVLKHVSDIKLRLRDDITNDFVLARLTKQDKEAIIEMTANAYFSKRLLEVLSSKSKEWKWNKDKDKYERIPLNKEEKKRIDKIAKSMFDGYMAKIYMTVVLNRNVDKNYLINVLSGYESKDEVDENMDEEKLKDTVNSLLADRERGEK